MPLDDAGRGWFFRLCIVGWLGPTAIQAWCAHRMSNPPPGMVCRIPRPAAAFRETGMKRIEANWSSLKGTRPHEYAVRFLFGGLATVAAGLIASKFGPAIGGLFLAFPAIFPAGASLIESHERKRKGRIGSCG